MCTRGIGAPNVIASQLDILFQILAYQVGVPLHESIQYTVVGVTPVAPTQEYTVCVWCSMVFGIDALVMVILLHRYIF